MLADTVEGLVNHNRQVQDKGGQLTSGAMVVDKPFFVRLDYTAADNDDGIQKAMEEYTEEVRLKSRSQEKHVMVNCYSHSTRRNTKVLRPLLKSNDDELPEEAKHEEYHALKDSWKVLHDWYSKF